MSSQPAAVSRPSRRYLRFSVRAMLVVVLLSGVWLGWIVRSARIQRDAVLAIRGAGAYVEYDSGWTENRTLKSREPWAPKWLIDWIGIDYFAHVSTVGIGLRCTDDMLAHVGRLTALRVLYLRNTNPTSNGLAKLRGLTKLSELDLWGTTVTDAGMARLESLTSLANVDLGVTRVSDAGLAHMTGMTNLSVLNLDHTNVTDAGLAHLKGLTKLSKLQLATTLVTDAGLIQLKGLTNLSALELRGTLVTDAGVNELNQALPMLKIAH